MDVIFTNIYLVSFLHRVCERLQDKLGKVKTTAEELKICYGNLLCNFVM